MSLTKKDVNTTPNFISDIHPIKHSTNPSTENTSKQKETNTSYTKIKLIKSTNSRKKNKGTDFLDYIKDKGIKFQIHYEGDDDTQETTPPKNRNSTNSTVQFDKTILPPPNTPNKPPSSPNINDNTSKNDTNDSSNKNKSNNNNSNIYNINVINFKKPYRSVNYNIINNNINNNNNTTINSNNINKTIPLTHSSVLNIHACPFIPPKVQNHKTYYTHAQLLKQQQQLRLQQQQQAAATSSNLFYHVNSVNKFIQQITSQTPYYPSTQQMCLQYQQLFLTYQYQQFILYLKNKQTLLSTSSKSISDEDDPERPFFYHNHNEEVQTTRILALIEFLFHKDNINSDYILRRLLNEDGYVSVDDLVGKHPLMKKFKISKKTLTDILTLHRQGQITETIETFDTILIRNREWSECGDHFIQNVNEVYSTTMMKMNKFYHDLKMRNINNNIMLSNMLKVYNQSMMAMQLQQYEKMIWLENVNGVV